VTDTGFSLGPWLGQEVAGVVSELEQRQCTVVTAAETSSGPLALAISLTPAPTAQADDHVTVYTAQNRAVRFTVDVGLRVATQLSLVAEHVTKLQTEVNNLRPMDPPQAG
jgi:hypothetical protein